MKLLVALSCLYAGFAVAQQDSADNWVWPKVASPQVSNDGKFVCFNTREEKNYEAVKPVKLEVKSIDGKWSCTYFIPFDRQDVSFTSNSRYLLFMSSVDSLKIADLLGRTTTTISNVKNFKLSDVDGNWIAYQTDDSSGGTTLLNIKTRKKYIVKNVINYFFQKKSAKFNFVTNVGNRQTLSVYDLANGKVSKIYSAEEKFSDFKESARDAIAFLSNPLQKEASEKIIYYNFKSRQLERFPINLSDTVGNSYTIRNLQCFTGSGNYVIFYANPSRLTSTVKAKSEPYIYKYTDSRFILPPTGGTRPRLACFNLLTKSVYFLENNLDQWLDISLDNEQGDTVLVSQSCGNCTSNEFDWNPACKIKYVLVDISNGKRYSLPLLDQYHPGLTKVLISPSKKHVVFYDMKKRDYYSYNIKAATITNLTKGTSASFAMRHTTGDVDAESWPDSMQTVRGVAGWVVGQKSVIIYDTYDVWRFDLDGNKGPLNLTQGYGRKNFVVFDILRTNHQPKDLFQRKEPVLLTAFNVYSKKNGFYKMNLNGGSKLDSLSMQSCMFYSAFYGFDSHGMLPVKAADVETYVVQRMTASESPNYYITNDFRTFNRISNVFPERNVNWMKAELVSWTLEDGTFLQGILYKPDDFDERKKYPVVVKIYQKQSDDLFVFQPPQALCNGCDINPAMYTGRGYLVFRPDIRQKLNESGISALESVTGAIKALHGLPYVNKQKIGLQGCSQGGYETNFIAMHSRLFAAACASSAVSNLILDASLLRDGVTNFNHGQYMRYKQDFWNNPDLYIRNSPVFYARNMTTPLLLMHTTDDEGVHLSHATSLFSVLRKEGKPVWFLQYDEANHGVFGEQATDFSKRMLQFFDFYLNDKPIPKWMSDETIVQNQETVNNLNK